jgi:hypothetical protein
MIRLKYAALAAGGILASTIPDRAATISHRVGSASAVHALFDIARPEIGPFPSDVFTVADASHNTGRRVNLPYPDCAVHRSDCEDLDVINTLDGFNLQTRLSIAFDGAIDANTVGRDAVFLMSLGSVSARNYDEAGRIVGINQIVWDVATNTLHVESDELLAQHTRYALIVTDRVRDIFGRRVRASDGFRRFRQITPGEYRHALLDAIYAARRHGIAEDEIVTASVYTTQSITPVMERIRDQIKAGTPDPAEFGLGPAGERAIFTRSDVAGMTWRPQTAASPAGFGMVSLDLSPLDVIPGAVAAIAFGSYTSPDYRVAGEYMPPVGTRSDVPMVQRNEQVSFTLYLPSTLKPPTGWPVAIVGVPTVRHVPMAAVAAMLASRGIATIGIHTAGCGFGPLGTLTITRTDGSSLVIPDRGRSIDQNADNVIGVTEGSVAARPRAWTIGERDGYRQTAADLMQLVRVIQVGVDADGDGLGDLDPGNILHFGFSAGGMHGTMFLALETSVSVAVESNVGGMVPEHARWSPVRRPALGASLQARTPSVINSPGLTAIDGVPVGGPHFNENKPLRDAAPVMNTVDGAIEIQRIFEMQEWGQQSGQTPIVWAPYLRATPLAGSDGKSVVYQFARADQQANGPGTAALLRAGDIADRTLHYRHDVAFAEDPAVPKNPHQVVISPIHPNSTFRSIARAMQSQIADFLASGGTLLVHPEPARFFEVPVAEPLSDSLNYIR